MVFYYCVGCARRPDSRFIRQTDIDLDTLPVAWDYWTTEERERRTERCAMCFRKAEVDVHHTAPRHLFGEEAEYWPMQSLCRPCHERWHLLVTPLMSRPTAVSEILGALGPDHPVSKLLERHEEARRVQLDRTITEEQRARWYRRQLEARLEAGEITREEFELAIRFSGKAAS